MALAEYLNDLAEPALRAALARCCAASAWVDAMAGRRPFASDEEAFDVAAEKWNGLGRGDWLEAFAAHPKIGDLDSLRARFAGTKQLASTEQAGTLTASDETLRRLAEGNRDYEVKFGYIFIVCATGKTADEMLAILDERLANDPATELPLAAAEQLKIMQLRLRGLAP